jgi:hypothetical protein
MKRNELFHRIYLNFTLSYNLVNRNILWKRWIFNTFKDQFAKTFKYLFYLKKKGIKKVLWTVAQRWHVCVLFTTCARDTMSWPRVMVFHEDSWNENEFKDRYLNKFERNRWPPFFTTNVYFKIFYNSENCNTIITFREVT